ncbi:MAG: tetratricopeptide repeat protein [Desulfobacterales bacterium]
MGTCWIAAPDDKTLSELMTMAKPLKNNPAGPLMRMGSIWGIPEIRSIHDPDPEARMPFNMENLGELGHTFDLDKGKLSNQYIVKTDDIRSIVAAFQQAGAASAALGGPANQRGDATDYSFSQSAPTLLQDMGKPRKPAPRKEDTAAFWLDKGLLYATYGNDAEAIKFYKKALQIEPENSNALFNMGVSYSSMGKYDQAIDVLNQAIFLAPDNGDYLYGLGWAYLLKGESVKAMEYIGTAADLGNPDARKYLIKHPARKNSI